MSVLLTGGSGYIGSVVLRTLVERGHDVIALVRSDEKAQAVSAAGARPVVGDITDLDLLLNLVVDADGIIHTASPGDATNAAVDSGVVETVIRGLAGRDTPYVHSGGIWVFGPGADLTEQTPQVPLGISAWRVDIEQRLRDSPVHSTIVAPGVVYGDGRSIPTELIGDGVVRLVGDGSQHWTTVHLDDVALLYVLALEAGAADEYYLGVSGENPTVRSLGEAVARGRGWEVVPETASEARDRFGEAYGDALLLDQQATGAHARESLGWTPSAPSLLTELESGSYAP
ncbi:NAD-dependent epimerase/dehydratase family protein [Frondihabitans australicus]|uniref:Nucleoside-diphosphate-sugar epimerase n=1 Tax=Frondihabitans australicus TaxID=386892 RepID=A0A495IHQ6_9MICO|nr:NAD-dependent epimerase/dehydratase family protein [Frondihabitans australicus]RKR74636.1 nucleoside-diphosphate-sugar epimerase [Frondihabitans australicus]